MNFEQFLTVTVHYRRTRCELYVAITLRSKKKEKLSWNVKRNKQRLSWGWGQSTFSQPQNRKSPDAQHWPLLLLPLLLHNLAGNYKVSTLSSMCHKENRFCRYDTLMNWNLIVSGYRQCVVKTIGFVTVTSASNGAYPQTAQNFWYRAHLIDLKGLLWK